jgi:lipopolysaccharide assembly protein A
MVEPKGQGESQGRSISAKVVIWIVVAVIALVLILQNTNKTKVHILFWDVTTGLWFLLVIVFALGLLVGWLLPKLRGNKNDD